MIGYVTIKQIIKSIDFMDTQTKDKKSSIQALQRYIVKWTKWTTPCESQPFKG